MKSQSVRRRSAAKHSGEYRTWNLQDAKARLSELVDRSLVGEPQVILRRGEPAVVIVPFSQYESLRRPRETLFSFLQRSPLHDVEIDVERSSETIESMRDVDL